MFCTKCGTQNPDDGLFCVKCGNNLRGADNTQNEVVETVNAEGADITYTENASAPLESVNTAPVNATVNSNAGTPQAPQVSVKLSSQTKKIIGISAGALLLIVVAIIVAVYFVNKDKDYREFKKAFDAKNYSEASTIYYTAITKTGSSEDARNDFKTKLNKYLTDKIANVKSDCKKQQDSFDYTSANLLLSKCELYMTEKSKVTDIQDYLSKMSQSKDYYKNGVKYEDKDQIETAIDYYKKVIKDDSNYDKAQAKIKQMYASLKQKALDAADKYAKKAEGEDNFMKSWYYEDAKDSLLNALDDFDENSSEYKEIKAKADEYKKLADDADKASDK